MKYILYTIVFALITASCAPTASLVSIDVLEPARISFPPEVVNVMIVDNSPSQAEEALIVNGEANANIDFISTDSVKAIMLRAMSQFMNEEEYFGEVNLYERNTNGDNSTEMKPLTARKVQSIAREGNADMLIVLDLFSTSATSEYVNTEYFEGFNLFTAKIGAILRTYDDAGEPLSPPILHLDSLYRESSTTWVNRSNSIEQMNGLIYDIAIQSADKLARTFIPSWKTYGRVLYSGGSKQHKEAAALVKEGKWAEAAEIWTSLYNTEKNRNKRIQLASNIALANEYTDNIEDAVRWINEAYNALPENSKSPLAFEVFQYRIELIERQASIPELYKQMGIPTEEDSDTAE